METKSNKKYQKVYYLENKERITEVHRKYRAENLDKIKAQRKEYNKNTKEAKREYYQKNKEAKREYHLNNLDKIRAKTNSRNQTPAGKLKRNRYNHKRRARIQNLFFDLTSKDIKQIFDRDKSCVYCTSYKKLSLDHIISISKGGATTFSNMVVSCKSCNSSKNNSNVFDWCKSKHKIVPEIVLSLLTTK